MRRAEDGGAGAGPKERDKEEHHFHGPPGLAAHTEQQPPRPAPPVALLCGQLAATGSEIRPWVSLLSSPLDPFKRLGPRLKFSLIDSSTNSHFLAPTFRFPLASCSAPKCISAVEDGKWHGGNNVAVFAECLPVSLQKDRSRLQCVLSNAF